MSQIFEITEGKLAKVNEPSLPVVKSEDMESILAEYSPHVVKAVELCAKAEAITVTDETQTAQMAEAKSLRKEIASTRIDAEKSRKFLKEESLRKGQIIDTIYREFEKVVKPIEKRLEEAEKFAELAQAKRDEELRIKREAELAPYLAEGEQAYQYGTMSAISESAFQSILAGAKLAKQTRDTEKAEADRLAKEKAEADAKERQRLADENATFKAQAEVDRKAREEAEAKLREIQVTAKVASNAVESGTELAKLIDEYVKQYGATKVPSLLYYMAGTVGKLYDDEERLEMLIENELEWKINPNCFR